MHKFEAGGLRNLIKLCVTITCVLLKITTPAPVYALIYVVKHKQWLHLLLLKILY